MARLRFARMLFILIAILLFFPRCEAADYIASSSFFGALIDLYEDRVPVYTFSSASTLCAANGLMLPSILTKAYDESMMQLIGYYTDFVPGADPIFFLNGALSWEMYSTWSWTAYSPPIVFFHGAAADDYSAVCQPGLYCNWFSGGPNGAANLRYIAHTNQGWRAFSGTEATRHALCAGVVPLQLVVESAPEPQLQVRYWWVFIYCSISALGVVCFTVFLGYHSAIVISMEADGGDNSFSSEKATFWDSLSNEIELNFRDELLFGEQLQSPSTDDDDDDGPIDTGDRKSLREMVRPVWKYSSRPHAESSIAALAKSLGRKPGWECIASATASGQWVEWRKQRKQRLKRRGLLIDDAGLAIGKPK